MKLKLLKLQDQFSVARTNFYIAAFFNFTTQRVASYDTDKMQGLIILLEGKNWVKLKQKLKAKEAKLHWGTFLTTLTIKILFSYYILFKFFRKINIYSPLTGQLAVLTIDF